MLWSKLQVNFERAFQNYAIQNKVSHGENEKERNDYTVFHVTVAQIYIVNKCRKLHV
jgi:hypothetical protein